MATKTATGKKASASKKSASKKRASTKGRSKAGRKKTAKKSATRKAAGKKSAGKKKTASKTSTKKKVARKKARTTKKSSTRKKTAAKKTTAARKPASRAAARSKAATDEEPGFTRAEGSMIFVPKGANTAPVPPQKLSRGIKQAKQEISKLVNSVADLTDGFEVGSIELSVSFNAKGEFLGVGVGGATTIKITFNPVNDHIG